MDTSRGFNRILLATDGSEQAQAAVDATIQLARSSSAKVRVLHIWNLEVHHRHGFWDVEVHSEAKRLVDAAVSRLQAAGLVAEPEIFRADNGQVAEAVAVSARAFSADLVVVGSRGLSDWQSMFKYSVNHQVLAALDCPLLIVKGRPTDISGSRQRVLLTVAGGEDIAPGVRAAIAAAAALESVVRVVHVAQVFTGAHGPGYREPDEEVQATMASAIKLLSDAGIPAEAMVAHGGPVSEAVADIARSWAADLIVIGSSRMGDLGSMVLGSVSHHLLRTTQRPVLIAERVRS